MSHMSPKQPSEQISEDWTACKAGTLREVADRAKNVRRRQFAGRMSKLAGIAAASVAGLLLVANFFADATTNDSARTKSSRGLAGQSAQIRLACNEVLDTQDAFLLGDISEATRDSVREHLSHCPHCQAQYRLRAQELQVEFTVLVLPQQLAQRLAIR